MSLSMRERFGVIAAAMAIVLSVAGGARADTISYADAITELAQACGADIKKFCKGVNLGNNQIQNCLGQHAAKVSPTCTSTLASVIASIEQRQQAQAVAFKVCASDAATLCRGIHGDEHILQCLLKTTKIDNGKCNQAITDAGWR